MIRRFAVSTCGSLLGRLNADLVNELWTVSSVCLEYAAMCWDFKQKKSSLVILVVAKRTVFAV